MNINTLLKLERHKGCSRFGAQMGRRNVIGQPQKLHLQRVDFVDGDYDTGGAYWGSGGGYLYCAFSKDETSIVFVRASRRKDALSEVKEQVGEGFTFYHKEKDYFDNIVRSLLSIDGLKTVFTQL